MSVLAAPEGLRRTAPNPIRGSSFCCDHALRKPKSAQNTTMSTTKNNSMPPKDAEVEKPKESVAPLEEDDEFEDFPVEGPTRM